MFMANDWKPFQSCYLCCSSTEVDSLPSACLRRLARHFKTEPTETVSLCFGYPKTPCRRAEGKPSTSVDDQHISLVFSYFSFFYIRKISTIYIPILLGVVLVRTAPTAFHNVVVDDSAWIYYMSR
jgi:hypothetical protein